MPGRPCPFPFPAMVKPRSGRSSLGQAVAADEKSYQTALAGREDCIVQPFLEGDIFCVDVARDASVIPAPPPGRSFCATKAGWA